MNDKEKRLRKKFEFSKPVISVNFMNDSNNYKNYKDLQLRIPASFIVIGKMGSGKSSFAYNFLQKMNAFRRVYVLCKDTENDPIYQKMKIKLGELEHKTNKQIFFISDDPNKIDFDKSHENKNAWKINSKFKNLVIIDDMVESMSSKELKYLRYLFKMSRHLNITVLFLTQSFYSTDKFIRRCCSNIVLCSIPDIRDLKMILRSYQPLPDLSIDDLYFIYQQIKLKNQFTTMHLDLNNPDLKMRIREDLLPVKIIRKE